MLRWKGEWARWGHNMRQPLKIFLLEGTNNSQTIVTKEVEEFVYKLLF